ncbi:unnamed protein product [Protopolystoma xenopodis]|uniref:Ion transport N-terminal domain-containing protein n=1 Tax=Protopolystoma xenopodis TaxID=117903 RepID=A0A448WJ09_9PLAT|nr:unnamed protein product [Protopolystoma xenopodis]
MRRRKGNFRTLAQTNKTAAGGDPSIAEPHRRHSRKPLLVHSNSIIPAVSNMAPCKEELIFRKTGRPRSLYRSKSLNRSNPRTDSHLKEHISSQEVTSFSASIAATNAASSSAGLNAGACTINAKITPTTLESGEINIHRCVQFSMSLCDMGIQADLANDGSERIRDIWTRQVDELHREVQVQSDEDFDLWIALATPHSEEASGIKPGDTPSRLVDRQVCCGRVISNDIRNKNQRDETHESRLMVSASTVATTTETEELGEEEEEENNDERPSNEARTSASAYLKEQFLSFFQPSDNKLAMKLFGTKNALNKERRRQQQQGKWIIHPCSSFR